MRYNSTLQEKAIEAAQKALYGVDRFDYLAADGDLKGMFVVWFCKTLQNWKAIVADEILTNLLKSRTTVIKMKLMLISIKK